MLGPASGELYIVIVFKAWVLAFLVGIMGSLWSCLISPTTLFFPAGSSPVKTS